MSPDELDPHSRRLRHVCGLDLQGVTELQTHAARRAYYGAVSYVDDQVGLLLGALQESGFSDDTIVLLLADHGDMLGERGLWYKMNFFEPACRIPFIVHAPGRFAARRVGGSASLVDLLPTLCELGGVTQPLMTPLDGVSLLPQFTGGSGRDEVIGEYLAEGAVAPLVMIRRDRFKFVHSPVDPDQLYDLRDDPEEIRNLAADPGHVERTRAFRAEAQGRWNFDALTEAVVASQRRRHLVYAALREGRFTPWDFQPHQDSSRRYVRNDQELGDFEAMARFPPYRDPAS